MASISAIKVATCHNKTDGRVDIGQLPLPENLRKVRREYRSARDLLDREIPGGVGQRLDQVGPAKLRALCMLVRAEARVVVRVPLWTF